MRNIFKKQDSEITPSRNPFEIYDDSPLYDMGEKVDKDSAFDFYDASDKANEYLRKSIKPNTGI